jgi:hypothetical protein
MSTNEKGSYRTTKANAMRAFDQLPPKTREALAKSVGNWVPQPLLTKYRRRLPGFGSDDELVTLIRWWNAQELAQREKQRAFGIGVYKGNHPDPKPLKRAPRRPR